MAVIYRYVFCVNPNAETLDKKDIYAVTRGKDF